MARRRARRRGWCQRRILTILIVLTLLAGAALLLLARTRPQDLPWTPLDLAQPMGLFTGRKIAALGAQPALCRQLMIRAGAQNDVMPPFGGDGECRVANPVKLGGGSRAITLRPHNPAMTCPVAAGMAVWEWEVIQPAARRILGQRVDAIEHIGTYNCRQIRGGGPLSQHATANAIDIGAFMLGDGTKVSVLDDWTKGGPKAQFLRAVRDGSCGLFSTVLSPDYNAAHANHLHLDQAARGARGWRTCK
ncbi:extensin family protein [Sphingobium boeckii]|uniref:Extensin-like C-terminal domain-containing protein n=1 Tax=Sphingobium boeckii TaxID=1082345 RepID=A0A7W9AL60_9SPHN|nr:extensin family protein [Sphingobium boeckii]MBB5687521.1 hypothetical protein [Sphingobium boeckii]